MDKNIAELIASHQLKHAIRKLRAIAKLPQQVDRLNFIEQTYNSMLKFMMEGVPDDNRAAMLASIEEDLLNLADDIEREQLMADDSSLYFSTLRMQRYRPNDLQHTLAAFRDDLNTHELALASEEYSRDLHKSLESHLRDIFNIIWVQREFNREERAMLTEILIDKNSPTTLKAQIISALLLSALKYYHYSKLSPLLDAYESDSLTEIMAARVLTAISLILLNGDQRLTLNRNLRDRLSLWPDNILLYSRLRSVLLNILRTRQTELINTKMREEVIPELLKLRPEIMKRFRDMAGDDDPSLGDVNPEWEELMDKSGISDKLRELQEMQMEGGDILMSSFSNLKGFPFFRELSNWLLPFDADHSELETLRNMPPTFRVLLSEHNSFMCASDKYSFALSLAKMSPLQLNNITSQWEAQMSQLKEHMAEENSKPENVMTFENEVSLYVRDLHRFFTLYRAHNEFPNPFANTLDIKDVPGIGDTLFNLETVSLMAEFYFKNQMYADALPLFLSLEEENETEDEHLLEKIGYCYQVLNDVTMAIEYFEKAELTNPDSEWIQKRLAVLYRHEMQWEKAITCYRKLLEKHPDNSSFLMNTGFCYLGLDKPQKALKYYYHVHYLHPERIDAIRALAWCELITGNYEKSRPLYEQILMLEPRPDDYLNAGHLAVLTNRLKEGTALYRESIRANSKGMEGFMAAFRNDIPTLQKMGISAETPYLILDYLSSN